MKFEIAPADNGPAKALAGAIYQYQGIGEFSKTKLPAQKRQKA